MKSEKEKRSQERCSREEKLKVTRLQTCVTYTHKKRMHEEPQRFKGYVENRERRSARPWHLVGRNRMWKIITKYIDEPKTQVTSGHWQSRNAAGTECVHGKIFLINMC